MPQRDGYVIAVDGGQSSTACVLGLVDGTVLSAGQGGPSNHVHQPGGFERLRRALEDSMNEALGAVTPRPERVGVVYLSLTGGAGPASEIVQTIVDADRVLAEGDARAALASGTFGGPGIGLIAGTGAVAVAENAAGERAYRGGWGYLVGDEGSGYWIGMQCLQACARAADGRGPKTALSARVCEIFGAPDLRSVVSRVYGGELDRPDVAELAPMVLSAAEEGDEAASAIIRRAAEELALLVEAACRAVQLSRESELVIVATGGVLRPGNMLWQALQGHVDQRLPGFRLEAPRVPPVVGAFVLGLQLAGVHIDHEVIRRVETSTASIPELARKQRPAATRA